LGSSIPPKASATHGPPAGPLADAHAMNAETLIIKSPATVADFAKAIGVTTFRLIGDLMAMNIYKSHRDRLTDRNVIRELMRRYN
jgi:hypothetical protein